MDIVKKNLWSIISGVVALVAIALFFVLVSGQEETLKSHMADRKKVYNELNSLRTQPRRMPQISLDNPNQDALGYFPSPPIIEKGLEAQKKVAMEAANAVMEAKRINLHTALYAPALSGRRGDSDRFDFQTLYRKEIDVRKTDDPQSIQIRILKGGRPPTPEQVSARSEEIWKTEYEPKIVAFNNANDGQVQKDQHALATKNLRMDMNRAAAEACMIYVDPGAMDVKDKIDIAGAPNVVDIWWAQVGLWVQTDVAKAIVAANASSKNVIDAPVKRLLRIEAPRSFVAGVKRAAPAPPPTEEGGDPNEVIVDEGPPPEQAAPGTVSFTDRGSNDNYDVVHFSLRIHVDAAKIPQVLAELSRNQFIYVYQVSVDSVDSMNELAAGYVYGSQPVALLTLNCEEIFLRSWTVELMPPEIRRLQGITQVPTPVAIR